MVGFWAKYYSTLFKGLTATSWKERREARRLVRGLKNEDHELYVKIREEVETHHVTGALKDLKHFIKQVRKSAEVAENLIFNAITQDRQIIKAEKEILDALRELSRKVSNSQNKVLKKVEKELAIAIYQGSKDAEGEERGEYKIVMEVINETHQHHKDWMEKIRTAFQDKDNQSYLARWVIRGEINRETRDIRVLQKVAKDIKALAAKVQTQKFSKREEDMLEEGLVKDYELVRDSLKDAFYESYLIKKRDLLMFLKILFNLHTLREWLDNWVTKHDLPRANVDILIGKIKELEDNIAKHFQPIAQGFRIIINAVDNVQELALEEAQEIR